MPPSFARLVVLTAFVTGTLIGVLRSEPLVAQRANPLGQCPDADQWLLVYWPQYWYSDPKPMQSIIDVCPNVDRVWVYTEGRWLGVAPGAPLFALDPFWPEPGQALFIHASTSIGVPPAAPTEPSPALLPDLPLIDAPPEQRFPCLQENPSCNRDPWWLQRNDLQRDDLVQFRFAPGLVSEHWYIEAIWLLWLWPEGKTLLQEAGLHEVKIITVSGERLPETIAAYRTDRSIGVSSTYRRTPMWMIADSLAHELRHAANHRAGRWQGRTYADCIENEKSAFYTEARFVRWLHERMGGFPPFDELRKRLSILDVELLVNIPPPTGSRAEIDAFVKELYEKQCRGLIDITFEPVGGPASQ